MHNKHVMNERLITKLVQRSKESLLRELRTNSIFNGKCQIWQLGHTAQRYARIKVPGWRWEKCSRVLWRIFQGEIPNRLCVLHSCDNRSCTEESHYFLGTRADNIVDMVQKHRNDCARGSDVVLAKLTDEKVREIRRRLSEGFRQFELRDEFQVSKATISKIARNKSWKHA